MQFNTPDPSRTDVKFLSAILKFAQMGAFIPFAIAIVLFAISVSNGQPEKRGDAIKMAALAVLLFVLYPAAKAIGAAS